MASKVRYHKQDSKGVQTMCKVVEEYGDERAVEALKQGIQLDWLVDYRNIQLYLNSGIYRVKLN